MTLTPERRLDLALADARHAFDYGTRAEYEDARRRARVAAAEVERCDIEARIMADPRAARIADALQRQMSAAAERAVPAGWPDYGPEPDRWSRR